MKSVASKSDMPSYGGILDKSGRISINTDLYKAFGVDSVKAPSKIEEVVQKMEEEKVQEGKEKDYDPERELPVEDGASRRPQVFYGSSLNMDAIQNQLLDSMANKAKHNKPVPASQLPGFDPNDPRGQTKPSQNQIVDRKVSIYDVLKQKQKLRKEIDEQAPKQANPPQLGGDQLLKSGQQQLHPEQPKKD